MTALQRITRDDGLVGYRSPLLSRARVPHLFTTRRGAGGAELDGSLTGSLGETGIKHGSVSGSEISFSVVLTINENRMELEFTGTVEGDEMSGEGKTAFGGFTWTARRVSGPGEEMAR